MRHARIIIFFEVETFFGLGVFECLGVGHVSCRHDTDTYNHIELYDFFKLLTVSTCRCLCRVRCLSLYFIDYN